MSKRALLEIEACLAELDAEELLMLRSSVTDLLLVYGTGDARGDPLAPANGQPSPGDEPMEPVDDAQSVAHEAGEALVAVAARKRRALN